MESLYAKVIDGIVVDVRVVSMEFIKENPDRYGDESLWHETFINKAGKTYAGAGYTYDPITDEFIDPSL